MHKFYIMIKRLYIKLIKLINNQIYKIDFLLCCIHQATQNKLMNYNEGNKMFLVPHADDDLLGGYALSKSSTENFTLGYFGLTGSNSNIENKRTRDCEFEEYCTRMRIQFVSLRDASELAKEIAEKNISIIFIPTLVDWHPEHRMLNYYLYDALTELQDNRVEIYWYSVSVPICSSLAEIVPMEKEDQHHKYNMFREIYKSQDHMPLNRFIYQERVNAAGTGCYSGEVFLHLDKLTWGRIVELIRIQENDLNIVHELNCLRYKINRIKKTRALSRMYYDELLEKEEERSNESRQCGKRKKIIK